MTCLALDYAPSPDHVKYLNFLTWGRSKVTKKINLFNAILFLLPISIAEANWSNGPVLSEMSNNSGIYDAFAAALIVHTNKGYKNVGFDLAQKKPYNGCSYETKNNKNKNIIFYINKQAIKGNFWCANFHNTNKVYYRFMAKTESGREFVADAFKKSRLVELEIDGYQFTFNANGFSAAWRASGDSAL